MTDCATSVAFAKVTIAVLATITFPENVLQLPLAINIDN
jgi:hypothetical protein